MAENTTPVLTALLNTIVVENQRGTYKNFHASNDYPLKGVTYPTDYGYLPGYLGEDGADLDVFIGPKEDGQSGYIRVARPDTENGETKFFVNTTTEEAKAIGEAFTPVLIETHTYPDRTDILEAIKPFKVEK